MAIYHFSAKVIGRGAGSSAVASAAYRSASRLHDERLDRPHDFSNKAGVVHSEVMLPERAPEHLRDREVLWNEVEAGEKRKDAQLAREVEFAIPRELTREQGVALAREFVAAEFVSRGMVADLNVHWDPSTSLRGAFGADGQAKPHAHVMLTMREVGADGFGAKQRDWNATALLQSWRENWASHVNNRLQSLGIEARIDHRSYEAQGVELEPQHKIGAAGARRLENGEDAERADEHRAIAKSNGAAILVKPEIGLDALTRTQATFTVRDLAMFAHRHSDGKVQFDKVLAAMRGSDALLALGRDGRGAERFTTVSMMSAEEAMARNATALAATRHAVDKRDVTDALDAASRRGLTLGPTQKQALERVTSSAGLGLVVGYAGSGKSAMLGVAREAWEQAGYTVRGAALSGIAAENLEGGSGIASRTIASLEHSWARDRDRLSARDVLVVDEAGMVGTHQLGRVLAEAAGAGAKVVLVGDVQQLQAIEAGAAFRLLAERHGAAEITEVRRQAEWWMRDATRKLATGRTAEALGEYAREGMVHAAPTRDAARAGLIERWDAERRVDPAASRIILTHMNKEVEMLNQAARQKLTDQGELGHDVAVRTDRGERMFADGDRILFLKNERELGVKNGTLATIERTSSDRLAVRLDDGRRIDVDLKSYAHVDHGYAATVHKTQGMTVDRTHVLATAGLDAHATYVALSRHRTGTALHYGRDDFASEPALRRTLSRERPKDMALDYTDAAPEKGRTNKAVAADRGAATERPKVVEHEHPGHVLAPGELAHTKRAEMLRAMVAAREAQPKQTAESMREAIAALKAAPAIERGRDLDYGAGLMPGPTTGGGTGTGPDHTVQQLAFFSAVIMIVVCWPLVRARIPAADTFAMIDLVREHWAHRHAIEPWLEDRWAWLALKHYNYWFALAALPGVMAASVVQACDRRTWRPLLLAPLGWSGGVLLGQWLLNSLYQQSWTLAVMMPATFAFLLGVIAARLGGWSRGSTHLRGTRLSMLGSRWAGRIRARLMNRVMLAGVPLNREDETMHTAVIGATGSGKSTALRGLMSDALHRGDRQVVADPEGAAMSAFFEQGDIILNPFDRCCARWDLLAEIERPSDYAFLAQSLLPHLGDGHHDQWITYAQQLLAALLESWVGYASGTTRQFITLLQTATVDELKERCAGTPAARYFEAGGERMLASILGTLAPAIGHLSQMNDLAGEPFSIRQWVRSGPGSLWMPYAANQVAALRGLVSCWMNIAILETLSLAPDRKRRIWFHVDELDALGRIEGLKDAQARLRKFGGCVAIGFQSFAQVKAVYGEGAHTIIENCGNLLLLRAGASDGGGTAKLASDLIGDREVERRDVSESRTRGRFTSRSTSMQTKRTIEDVTLASEIMQLGNREGYLKRATNPRWTRVAFPHVDYPQRTAAFEPRPPRPAPHDPPAL